MDNSRQFKEFLTLLTKLEPIEFYGLCKVLCIQLEVDNEPRPFEKILDDILTKFPALNRKQRRDIIKVLRGCATAPKE